MAIEEKILHFMRYPSSKKRDFYSRYLNFLALDMITEPLNIPKLAVSAIRQEVNHRLGFHSVIAARASRISRLKYESQKLYQLARALYTPPKEWQFLDPWMPDFGKRIMVKSSTEPLNIKWKIYSTIEYDRLVDWIDLYITEKYLTESIEERMKRQHVTCPN